MTDGITSTSTITVGGLPGTGTSTLSHLLSDRTGLRYEYAGALFRAEAARREMSLAQFGALCESDPAVDRSLDDRQVELLREGGLLLEGRMAGWLANHHGLARVHTVWVTCDDGERFRRIAGRDGEDTEAARAATITREASEADRFLRYHGADLTDLSGYDIVLDSTSATPDQLADAVLDALVSGEPSAQAAG